jgi:hypothetical protein
MKNIIDLYEASILGDIEDTIEYGDIVSRLATFWMPLSFLSNQGPVELNNFLKKFDWKALKKYEKPVKINDREYGVFRPWNKKPIKDKCYNLIKYVLSQKDWDEAISMLNECTPSEYHISEEVATGVKDRKTIIMRAYESNVVLKLSFERNK